MRSVFTYRSQSSTFATFSGKARRQQYCESATEMAALREAEMKTEYLDFQFQPARIEWLQPNGKWRGYTFDAAFEMQDGSLAFDEFKATASDFSKPLVKAKIEAARAFLRNYDIKVRTRSGLQLQHNVEDAAIRELWAVRRTKLLQEDIDKSYEIIDKHKGQTSLVQFIEAIHSRTDIAFGMASALMMRRAIRIHLDKGLVPEALVSVPPAATPGRLRRFLARWADGR